jgi:hypothetical protein
MLTIRGRAPHALEFAWRARPGEAVSAAISDTLQRHADPIMVARGNLLQRPSPAPAMHGMQWMHEPKERFGATAAMEPSTWSNGSDGLETRRGDPQVFHAAGHEDLDDRVDSAMIDNDARAALMTAGYKPREARAAVERARPHVGADATLEQVVREALKRCTRPSTGSSVAGDAAGAWPHVGASDPL